MSVDAYHGWEKTVTAADREIIRNHGAFIWSVADLLRGDYRRSEYGRVILPRLGRCVVIRPYGPEERQ